MSVPAPAVALAAVIAAPRPAAPAPKRPLSDVDPSIANITSSRAKKPRAAPKKKGPVYAVVRETMTARPRDHRHTKKDLAIFEDIHAANMFVLRHKDVTSSAGCWHEDNAVGLRKGLMHWMSNEDLNHMTTVYVEKRKRLEGCSYNEIRSTEEEVQLALDELGNDEEDGSQDGYLGDIDFVVDRYKGYSRRR